ncbi:MAG TPA: glycosyltransferase family 9 protein [Puia sp.]
MQVRRKQKIDKYIGYLLIAFLLPFTRLLGITLRRDHSAKEAPRRILFIKLLGLGSLVLAADAIAALRQRYPNTRFILLTDANIAAGIAPFGLFDEVIAMPTDRMGATLTGMARHLVRSWGWRGLWVIDLEVYSKLTTVLALLTLARNRYGFYLSPVPFRKYLNTHNIPFSLSAFLEENYNFMARQVGGEAMAAVPTMEPTAGKTMEQAAAGLFSEPRVGELRKPYILLNNTCSGLADVRRLPDQTFSEICRWILDHTTYDLALLGAPGDKEDIDRFIWNAPDLYNKKDRILNFAGMAADFESYYRFLREKGVCLITIDSGPLHIARKLGLPTLSLWGPTDPANYLNVQPQERHRHLSYYLEVSCSPCVHRQETLPCGGDNICMKNIQAGAIIGKIEELLQRLGLPSLC